MRWCPKPESNRHGGFSQPADFKSAASTCFAIRARGAKSSVINAQAQRAGLRFLNVDLVMPSARSFFRAAHTRNSWTCNVNKPPATAQAGRETQRRFTKRWLASGQSLPLSSRLNLLSAKHFLGTGAFQASRSGPTRPALHCLLLQRSAFGVPLCFSFARQRFKDYQ